MTGRSVSWTDAENVARLLARATGPRRVPSAAKPAPPEPVKAHTSTPPAATTRASTPPPAPEPEVHPAAPTEIPKLELTSDNPTERLDALLAWTLDHQRCEGAFIADDNGLTLTAHGIPEAHVSLVGPLLSALVAVRGIPGIDATSGALWLGTSMMSWVEARTERGGFCLGVIGPEALSTESLNQLKAALVLTIRNL